MTGCARVGLTTFAVDEAVASAFRALWSDEDDVLVGLCAEFPSLST